MSMLVRSLSDTLTAPIARSISPERIELTRLSGNSGTMWTRMNGEMRDSSLISRGKR